LVAVTLLSFGVTGCGGVIRLAEYKPPTDYSLQFETSEGIAVAVDAVAPERHAKEYFGLSLRTHGLLPIAVVVENRGGSSVIIRKEGFSLDGQAPAPEHIFDDLGEKELKKGGNMMTAGSILCLITPPIALGVVIGAAGKIKKATQIPRGGAINAWNTHTLSPGQTAKGIVYFPYSGNRDTKARKPVLRVEALDPVTGSVKQVDVPVRWGREAR